MKRLFLVPIQTALFAATLFSAAQAASPELRPAPYKPLAARTVLDPTWAGDISSSVARGGRLYDNWYRETGERPPKEPHAAYPVVGKYRGDAKATWRCRECHGWDYRGKDGAYSAGPHFTEIVGIWGMAGGRPAAVIEILKDRNHGYGGVMAEEDLRDLAKFVIHGQVDMTKFIDSTTKSVFTGTPARPKYFNTICANCHGRYGHALHTIPPVGDIARANPWETLHKILNGHPGANMPPLRSLSQQHLAGILAYAQTLPDGEILSSVVRGGRLYDSWRKELDLFKASLWPASPANYRHPAYPIDKAYAKSPYTNWRCKECHGWDYLGKDGAYAKGSHYTGIKGIRGMSGADPEDIFAVLKDKNHAYGDVLEYREFRDLANFVSRGQIDMDLYIDRKTGLANGNKERLATHFLTICATCHGAEGHLNRSMLPLGRLARSDPWQTLHIIVNGHPDEEMPAMRALGITDVVDILAYIQSLPQGH